MTKDYRITARRPIRGRLRKVDEVVQLTDAEYAAEERWGGLELVTPKGKAPKPDKPGSPD